MLPKAIQKILEDGLLLQSKGRLVDASAHYARVRAAAPDAFEAWHYGGMVALLAGQGDEAARLLAQALRLKPEATQTSLGLGVAHVARGDLAGAESLLCSVTEKDPKLVDGWHYLALVYETQGRSEDAIAARKRVITLKPNYGPGWSDFGATLSQAGRQTEALDCFSKALRIDSKDLRSRLGRAMILFKCHRVKEAAAEYAAILARDPSRFEARSFRLMAINSLPEIWREQNFTEHVSYGKAAGDAVRTVWPNLPEPQRRLRVAFLSPDLREHSVAYFIEPLLRHLDSAEFEIVLYHDHASVDWISEQLKTLASIWRNFAGRTDEMVEATILADAPDILIDLAGHTGMSRLRVFARRAAPVQITYLGYPNTTGVTAMDYRFVDALTDPEPAADAFATEKLVRFAPTAWSYSPIRDVPEVGPLPALTNGYVTFGAFNNFTKVTDETLSDWSQLLAMVPGSRLLLKADGLAEPAVGEPIRRRLRASGIEEARVELLSRTPDTFSHLALYNRVDIALDTYPYNGTTTTCEALLMGVPVVTIAGKVHASRVGVSLLSAVGHPEWIASSADGYVRIAAELAGDLPRLAGSRAQLRDELRASPLMDHAGQAKHFSSALHACWTNWCEVNATSATPRVQEQINS